MTNIPLDLIPTINRLVRTSRGMLLETGHEPTPEELAERLKIPPETVQKLLQIARAPITLAAP
jgi:RNA polymerase primary sigma factor